MTNQNLVRIAVMDYMRVVNRLQDPYINAEKAWKPIHQERINRGIITGWYLYKVHFAYAAYGYNFATINTYAEFDQLENPYPKAIIENTHPDKGYDGFEDLTEESRQKVRSEMSVLVDQVSTNRTMANPSKYLKVAFQNVAEVDKDFYKTNENKIWRPVHAHLCKEGNQDWWALYQLEFPHGTAVDYQFITISAVSKFSQLDQLDYWGAYKAVHPQGPFETDIERTMALRSTYRAELWELIDYLEK